MFFRKVIYRYELSPQKFPKPETDKELEIITDIYFGMPLHLQKLDDYHSYEVLEKYNSYHGNGYEYSEGSCEGYDHSGNFWNYVIGELYWGGIAVHSYGQYKIKGHREEKRIKKWISNRSTNTNYVRKPFMRLANKYGVGESRNILDKSALPVSRVDGVSEVSKKKDGSIKEIR